MGIKGTGRITRPRARHERLLTATARHSIGRGPRGAALFDQLGEVRHLEQIGSRGLGFVQGIELVGEFLVCVTRSTILT
jgi:hypothetical protein